MTLQGYGEDADAAAAQHVPTQPTPEGGEHGLLASIHLDHLLKHCMLPQNTANVLSNGLALNSGS